MSNEFDPPAELSTPGDPTDPETVLGALTKMRPWQNLIGWVFTVSSVLIALLTLFAGFGALMGGLSGLAGLLCILPVYGLMGWVYWMLGSSLRSSAMHIQRAAFDDPAFHIQQSLEGQATFWKIAGILMMVVLVLYALMLVVMVGLLVMGASLGSAFNSF